ALESDPDSFGSTLAEALAIPDERWRESVADRENAFFLAVGGEADVGLVRFSVYEGLPGLFSLWVAPSHRGRGVGRALVERVVDEARTRGHARLFLDVGDFNRDAIALYDRCGFHPTGRTSTLPPPRSHITEHERMRTL